MSQATVLTPSPPNPTASPLAQLPDIQSEPGQPFPLLGVYDRRAITQIKSH